MNLFCSIASDFLIIEISITQHFSSKSHARLVLVLCKNVIMPRIGY